MSSYVLELECRGRASCIDALGRTQLVWFHDGYHAGHMSVLRPGPEPAAFCAGPERCAVYIPHVGGFHDNKFSSFRLYLGGERLTRQAALVQEAAMATPGSGGNGSGGGRPAANETVDATVNTVAGKTLQEATAAIAEMATNALAQAAEAAVPVAFVGDAGDSST